MIVIYIFINSNDKFLGFGQFIGIDSNKLCWVIDWDVTEAICSSN